MRFALIENKRVEAVPKEQGYCPICSEPVIAKCGTRKMWHWAHRSLKDCDSWWEPETEWHRNWKNKYPIEWQEKIMIDNKTGEKHIADIKTANNLVIEFQHSPIKTDERISRENFYNNLIWVVDGTRLKKDFTRFVNGKNSLFFTKEKKDNEFRVDIPEQIFPNDWIKSSVPVVFDFLGLDHDFDDEIKNTLWCLAPIKERTKAIIVGFKREEFIQLTMKQTTLFLTKLKQLESRRETQSLTRRREQTHVYNPKKGTFSVRRRF